MTGARELVRLRVITPEPDQVRLSILADGTQLDVSLPLDAPVASLLPELVKLVQSRDGLPDPSSEGPTAKDAKCNFWVLSMIDAADPLAPDATLRTAGVVGGSLLRLTSQRALSAPTLYDDVVDAAARLNRAAYAGWDSTAARWMAFAGTYLSAAALLYFMLGEAFAPHRPAMLGISVVVAAALTGLGALAHRTYRESASGAALGWAAIPISLGAIWAVAQPFGGYGLAGGYPVALILLFGMYRAVGTGLWGYLMAGVAVALCGAALAVHHLGVRAELAGAGLAVAATLACLAVPWLTAPMGRFKGPRTEVPAEPEAPMFENPFDKTVAATRPPADEPTPQTPTAEGVWDRVRTVLMTRSALYAGFAVSAAAGASAVLAAQTPPHWTGLVFGFTCASTLALYVRRQTTALERASLAVPALILVSYLCWAAQTGRQPLPLVAFSVLLAAAVTAALVGMKLPDRGTPRRLVTPLRYLDYATSAALIPLALWVAGVYSRLGS